MPMSESSAGLYRIRVSWSSKLFSIHESTEHLSEVLQMFLLTAILAPHNIYLSLFTHCFVLFGLM